MSKSTRDNQPFPLRAIALVAAALLVLSACGSDAGTDTASSTDGATADDAMPEDGTNEDGTNEDGMAEDDMAEDGMAEDDGEPGGEHGHGGDAVDVSDLDPAPAVSLEATADPKGGFNLHVVATGHRIAPEHASTDHVPGEGHMHLFVDGERVSRFYNEWVHLPDPGEGEHTVRVELSANSHDPLAIDGAIIEATTTITGTGDGHGQGGHGDPRPVDVADLDPTPSVSLEVSADPKGGFNVRAVPTGHRLAPEKASTDHVPGEGHMHLFVGDERIGRMYGEWMYLPDPGEGEHTVRVELSANSHDPLAIDGAIIEATTTITGTGDGHDGHGDGGETAAAAEIPDDADHVFIVEFVGGEVVGGVDRESVSVGSKVALQITSDVAEEVHAHGVNVYADIEAGATAVMVFTASIPGVFEVELEDSGRKLIELEVS